MNNEEEYEEIESLLLMAVGQFEYRWEKAWYAWVKTIDMDDEEAAYMVNHCPYDDDGNTLPEATAWYEIYDRIKTMVEKAFDAEIIVDGDGTVFARHHLPDGDTITVP